MHCPAKMGLFPRLSSLCDGSLFKLLDSPALLDLTPQIVGKICSVFGRFSVVSYSSPYNETMMNECIGAHPKDYFVMDLLFGFHI